MKRIFSLALAILMLTASLAVMTVPASAAKALDEFDFDFENGKYDGIADVKTGTYDSTCFFRSEFAACIANDAHNTNKYYELTGASNYMNVYFSNGSYTYTLPNNDFIFSYDVRIISGSGEVRLFNPYIAGLTGEQFLFTVNTAQNGQMVVGGENKTVNVANINFSNNVWHNIAVSAVKSSDSFTFTLYVDGVKIVTTSQSGTELTGIRLGINNKTEKELHYDNFRIYEGTTPKAPEHLALMNGVGDVGFIGSQIKENQKDVRLVGVIGKELNEYEELGFKVEANGGSYETEITKAYKSIVVAGETVDASDLGAKYFFTFVIKEANNGSSFRVTSFARNTDEDTRNYATISFALSGLYEANKTIYTVDGVGSLVREYSTDIFIPTDAASHEESTYGKIIRLEHSGANNGILLATRETENTGAVSVNPIYRSTDDGKSWSQIAIVKDSLNQNASLSYQPYLFELPENIGGYSAGTVLMAGCTVLSDMTTILVVHASTDCGVTWTTVGNIVSGMTNGNPEMASNGVWEPVLIYDDVDNKLYCFYSDESDDGHNQKIAYRYTTDLQTWSETFDAVAPEDSQWRPGMAAITRMGNGKYAMVFELAGYGTPYVYIKIGNALDEWGDVSDYGEKIVTDEGLSMGAGPSIAWIGSGGERGMLLVTGQNNYPYTADRKCDMFISLDYGQTWISVENSIMTHHNTNVRCGYSSGMFVSSDGTLYYVNDPERDRGGECEKLTFAKIKFKEFTEGE